MGSGNGQSLKQQLAAADKAIDAKALGRVSRDMSAKTFATEQVAGLVHKLPKLKGQILTVRLIQAITEYSLSLFDELADPTTRLLMVEGKAARTEETARFCLYVIPNLDAFLGFCQAEQYNLFDADSAELAAAIIDYKSVAMPPEMACKPAAPETPATDGHAGQG